MGTSTAKNAWPLIFTSVLLCGCDGAASPENELVAELCDLITRCDLPLGTSGVSSHAQCIATYNAVFKNTRIVPSASALACIKALKPVTCDEITQDNLIRDCEDIDDGTSAVGECCASSSECSVGTCQKTSFSDPFGSCQPPAGLGEACAMRGCQNGLSCVNDGSGLFCATPPGVGEPCTGSCADGAYCIEDTCTAASQEGQSCQTVPCAIPDLYCETTSTTCVARKADGENCSEANACRSFYCEDGICSPAGRDEGESCDQLTTFCRVNLFCKRADSNSEGSCEKWLDQGAPCFESTDSGCRFGLVCSAGSCQPAPQVGESCDDTKMRCAPNADLYCGQDNICQKKKPVGETCQLSVECAFDHACIDDICTALCVAA